MIRTTQVEPAFQFDRIEHTPPVGVNWHPYADIFPWLDGPAREELKADIAKNGVLEPIVFLGEFILDGRNRYIIARELGIEYPRVEYVGDDPLGFVLSKNLSRRHLTDRQRADVAAKLAKLPKGANQHSSIETPSIEKAAEILDVAPAAVKRSKAIQEKASPELKAVYDAGAASQSAVAEVATLPQDEQAEIVAKGEDEIVRAAKEIKDRRKAARDAEKAKNQAASAEVMSQLPADVRAHERAKADAIAAKKQPADVEALTAEIEELREATAALEAENANLKAELKRFDEMRVQFEHGGFEAVIAGKDEQIRVLRGQVERESQEKVANLRSADWWKKKATELGYSSREVIDLDA